MLMIRSIVVIIRISVGMIKSIIFMVMFVFVFFVYLYVNLLLYFNIVEDK